MARKSAHTKAPKKRAAMPDAQITFGGTSMLSGSPGKPIRLADRYIPLDSMSGVEKRQAFGLWLGLIYLNRIPAPHGYTEGIRPEDDPIVVLEFTEDYESGAWRKLDRGMTLEELVRYAEFSQSARFMCLINAGGPRLPNARIERRLVMPADAILELVTWHYRMKAGARRHPWMTLCSDGKMGHCVTLTDSDEQGLHFAYHDPWPGRSLFCEENNVAGVKARSLGTAQVHFPERSATSQLWELTRNELARVLVATLVPLGEEWATVIFGMMRADFPPKLKAELKKALVAQADSADPQ